MRRSGRCLCGATRFRARLLERDIVACHCGQCRRQSGHYWAAVEAEADTLEIDGAANIQTYRASDAATRSFCRVCGTWLFWRGDGDAAISISAGALDDLSGLTLAAHIYVEGRPDYYALDPDLPAFAADRSRDA